MTDVAGVLDGSKVMKAVSCSDVEALIRQNKVSGGMVLKLEACKRALAAGVKQVRIVGGTSGDGLISTINGQKGPGTRVTAATYPAAAGVGR
jgi:acetylglutamate kinase